MVDVGPLAPITCPNRAGCCHRLEDHRYNDTLKRWDCTAPDCHEVTPSLVTFPLRDLADDEVEALKQRFMAALWMEGGSRLRDRYFGSPR